MLEQIEGSKAMAKVIGLCRPQVVCAYPITPQTHIVEGLGELVRSGCCRKLRVHQCGERVRGPFGRHWCLRRGSAGLYGNGQPGPAVHGGSCLQCAGLGLPIVMTLGNRAIGAPINIWNDHSDAMALRESGWIQLFAEDNQEAADLHIIAFKLAEELSVPTMVCVDGFILTHAMERIDIPGPGHG
jgi:pyruvate ferredoxin oxidoreductase alpha subunit